MMTNARTVVLICGKRRRVYPLPLGMDLKDTYEMDGATWTVVAVLTSEDVPINNTQPLVAR